MAKQVKKASKRNTVNLGVVSYRYKNGHHTI